MGAIPSLSEILPRLLEATRLRHQVIAQNVANVNTPGYHHLEVAFEEELKRRLAQAGYDPRELHPLIVEGGGATPRADGNNVDIDREMGRLAKNALLHTLFSQMQAGTMTQMRAAILGR